MITQKQRNIIKELFRKEQTLDYIDISDKTGIDLEVIVAICDELEREGIIQSANDGRVLNGKQCR